MQRAARSRIARTRHDVRRGFPAVRAVTVAVAVSVTALAACAPPSKQDIETAQAIAQLGDAYNDVRLTQQELQDQIDSLKTVVARQDSVIRSLANLAGVPVPR
ncbi:MAG: hypothetical protein IT359_21555 [Gemmatimonadaceae bacterium]|nr:hypothetical protein [Gemmatimonadaceae bacterium]